MGFIRGFKRAYKRKGLYPTGAYMYKPNIQPFREKLSEKVHATIIKDIVGSF